MFVVTVINFLLSSLYTGSQVAIVIVYIRKALILDIDYPLSETPELVGNALRDVRIVWNWATYLSVSTKLSLSDSASIHAGWRCYSVTLLSFGGLGPSLQNESGYSSYRLFRGLELWVNRHFLGSSPLLLNLCTLRIHRWGSNMDINP